MNIHVKLTGKTEEILRSLITKGYAADKSEAIRLALLFYDERFQVSGDEKTGWLVLAEKSVQKVWDNAKDDEAWRKY